MHKDSEQKLKLTYPSLFGIPDDNCQVSKYGLDIGDGWVPIVDAVLQVADCESSEAGQIWLWMCKQKAFTLRMSFRAQSPND